MPTAVSKPFLHMLGATVLAVALSVVRYHPGPSISGAGIVGEWYSLSRVPALVEQLRDPFVGLSAKWQLITDQDAENLFNAARWRILPPFLAHLLGLSPSLVFALPLLGSCLLVAAAAHYAEQESRRWEITTLVAVLTATSSAFFVSADWIQFDAYYLLALLVVTFSPSSLAVWTACSLGPWIDERFLLILPVCILLRYARTGRLAVTSALLGIAPYVAARLAAVGMGDGSLAYQLRLQADLLSGYLARVPLGWWMGFRAAWPLIAIGVVAAWAALPGRAKALYAFAVGAGLAAIVYLACDISRSIALLLPFLITGASAVARTSLTRRHAAGLALLAILNLSLPASHIVLQATIPIGHWVHRVHLSPPAP